MKHIDIAAVLQDKTLIGSKVTVCGWVRTSRDSAAVAFLELTDGTSFSRLQVVVDKSKLELDPECTKCGASVTATGIVVKAFKGDGAELNAESVSLLGKCPNDYPIQKKRTTLDFLRGIPHLRLRTNTFSAVFRVRSVAAQAIHRYFHERRFYYVHAPLITASDCEGAGEQFQVTTLDLENVPKREDGKVDYTKDFFGKMANLTVSGQLEGETYALALKDIYTFGPTFRAENSNTTRHLAEFWMVEPEMAFTDLYGDMEVAEKFLKYIFKAVLDKNSEDMEFFNKFVLPGVIESLEHVITSPFEHMTYTEAIKHLEKNNDKFEFPVSWGVEIQTEHERYLTEEIAKRPVIVTDYPKDIKAFYMKMNEDGKTVRAMDVLAPRLGEIIGGSEREYRYDVLLDRMKELGLDPAAYWWYLDLRKYGSVPHAGFGLGFERAVRYVTGIENIRDVIPYPRYVKSCEY